MTINRPKSHRIPLAPRSADHDADLGYYRPASPRQMIDIAARDGRPWVCFMHRAVARSDIFRRQAARWRTSATRAPGSRQTRNRKISSQNLMNQVLSVGLG